jgi:NodT family efflux transporter outer membrane factor (OMF) lipoprotein
MHRYRPAQTLLAFALLASSGCASTRLLSTAAPPAPTPAWHTAAEGVLVGEPQDLSRWWEQLADETLTDLIDRALAGSPDIRTARARLSQARAQRGLAGADLLPSASTSGSASDRRGGAGAFSAGFDASWEPDVFGGTRAGVDAAEADLRATAEDLHGTQVSLAAEVARNYVELRTLQTRLDIARRNEASQAETLELTGFRAQAGLVGSLDVEQARANLEQTRAQIPALESSLAQAMHRLATLAGLEPAALTAQLGQAAPLPAVPSRVAIGIPAETLRQRPDVRAAEQRIVAEIARLAQAEARRYPQFTLSGSIGFEIVRGALSGGTSLVASAAGGVLQTIFDGGRIRQQIAVQSAVEEQAVASYEATVLTALEEVENALVALEKSRQRLSSLAAAAEASTNAALLARNQYTAGLADFQTVLDTERTVRSVEDAVATTEGDRVLALVQLYKALGGGWSPASDALALAGKGTS